MATRHDTLQILASEYASAWSSGDPAAVAAFYTADGQISVNQGEAQVGPQAITELVASYHAEIPDLEIRCDLMRATGHHAVFVWTLEGHHAGSEKHVVIAGWEEWELDQDLKIRASQGWFDTEDFQRQINAG